MSGSVIAIAIAVPGAGQSRPSAQRLYAMDNGQAGRAG